MAKEVSMKWHKFLQLREKNPQLVHDLMWTNNNRNLKDFVRTTVGFIAYRPFETIDLSTARESITSEPMKSEYQFVEMSSWKTVRYNLWFHVEGEGESTRGRFVGPDIGDGSIQAHIDEIKKWFAGCEVFRGKQLIWERIVKKTVSGSSHAGTTEVNFEIFLFPQVMRK